MVDPRRIVSQEKVVNEIRIYKIFLLARNPKDRRVIRSVDPEEAIEILRNAPEQWYNNYLTTFGARKEKRRAELFKKLFEIAEPYVLNTIASVEKVRNVLVKVVGS